MNRLSCKDVEIRNDYDSVFHLVTVAKGTETCYTTANNAARTETFAEKKAPTTQKAVAETAKKLRLFAKLFQRDKGE